MNLSQVKVRKKLEHRLGELRTFHGSGCCWVCGSGSGVKTSRESYGTRCVRCIEKGRTTPDVEEYERLKLFLSTGKKVTSC
jgi:hypothetical protein